MAQADVFALQNSGLSHFLFADVGIEQNGSALTVLSVLARLGKDPWAEAARWAALPRAAAIECLSDAMARMPLCQAALHDARDTAARLVLLLPARTQPAGRAADAVPGASALPKGLPMALFWVALAIGMAINFIAAPHSPAPATPTTSQSRTHSPR